MFILYAIPVGIAIGYLVGGRLDRLGELRFRWAPLALLGLAVQIALFSDPLATTVGAAGPPIYVASTAAVLVAVLRNLDISGIPIVAYGAATNLIAIVANGGYMPAAPEAVAAIGGIAPGFSNSTTSSDPALGLLTDIFALPAWIPFSNVFSIGDVCIGLGVLAIVVAGMRSGAPVSRRGTDGGPVIDR